MTNHDSAGTARPAPLLLPVKDVLALVGCGRTLWLSMVSSGRTPAPVRLGRKTMWRREEILAWVEAGCPAREKWERMRGKRGA
jgi:predicted DNA-binding transcriptional regulator AlpA